MAEGKFAEPSFILLFPYIPHSQLLLPGTQADWQKVERIGEKLKEANGPLDP